MIRCPPWLDSFQFAQEVDRGLLHFTECRQRCCFCRGDEIEVKEDVVRTGLVKDELIGLELTAVAREIVVDLLPARRSASFVSGSTPKSDRPEHAEIATGLRPEYAGVQAAGLCRTVTIGSVSPQNQSSWTLVNLDPCLLDHLPPFADLVVQQLAELLRRPDF